MTSLITTDPRGDGTYIYVDDRLWTIFTKQTDPKQINLYIDLLRACEPEAVQLARECDERREWNIQSKGNGRDWPIFRHIERFKAQLQSQAGIKDS